MMHLYHGMLEAKKLRFGAFSHFGTYKAAVDRIGRRLFDGHTGDPLILKICFRFKPGSVLHLSGDWGSNQPIAMANALKKHFEHIDQTRSQIFEEIRSDLIDRKLASQEFMSVGWLQLSNALGPLGITAVTYPNAVEDRGSSSYCVIPETRRICVGQIIPSDQEIEDAKKLVSERLQPVF